MARTAGRAELKSIQITSVSTRKTILFDTQYGVFSYRSIKKNIYFGYKIFENNSRSFSLATPEKAILDYLYLHSEITSVEDLEGLRFNIDLINSIIDKEKLNTYLSQYDNLELKNRCNILQKYLNA